MVWWIVSAVLIVLGLAGTILPALPGTALILAGIVLGAWIDDFTRVGAVTITFATALAIASWLLDYLAGAMGARKAGASRQAVIGAALGTLLGIFLGFVGVLFMPFVGAIAGEYMARRDHRRLLHVGVATWLGTMIGMVAKVVLAFVMAGLFIAALLI